MFVTGSADAQARPGQRKSGSLSQPALSLGRNCCLGRAGYLRTSARADEKLRGQEKINMSLSQPLSLLLDFLFSLRSSREQSVKCFFITPRRQQRFSLDPLY